ncbi:MAG: indole-3-glycerol phosphate synthase TrpC [Flavobacteriaceae bacterium]|nr:indole-3-glycerol phosphate synthase TrpC [Flavobacteriaceae bacterium]
MTILDSIKQHQLKEVALQKVLNPIHLLEKSALFNTEPISLKKAILNPKQNGIIAEFKRKSPSKGAINLNADVKNITAGYINAGASALSILTNHHFFGAQTDDFKIARTFNNCPILRKDFMLDEYQIIESKSMGADVILLIAKMLSPKEVRKLAKTAKDIGLEVFLELQNQDEIEQYPFDNIDLVGINNRNLNTFKVDPENSIKLAQQLPSSILKIAESGIESAKTIQTLKEKGFNGFLIGEYFMRSGNPAEKCHELIQQLR